MNRNFNKIQIFLVIIITFSIPLSSAYFQYCTLAAADFLSPNLNFETSDQEYLQAANQSQLKVARLGGFFNLFQLATCLFGERSHLLSQIPSLNQENLVLRC
jgi:hypothetical protein